MSAFRGRLGQFNILQQQKRLVSNIVPTVLLTQNSLLSMLAQHDALILKPVVGRQSIKIYRNNGTLTLWINEVKQEALTDESVYEIIQPNLENQNYVIQPMKSEMKFWGKSFHRLVTLQKKSAQWEVTSSTKLTSHSIEGMPYLYHFSNIKKIAQLAAETLHSAYPNCETIVLEVSFNLQGEILIHDSYLHFSISKWNQYQSIGNYMPATQLLTEATFQHFLLAYETVYLKPCNGQHGKGIAKITKDRYDDYYEIHIGRTKWIKNSLTEVNLHLQEHLSIDDYYLIQQGIPLATIENCVFDVRVMLQKVAGSWQVAGKAVKVAGDDFFITNAVKAIVPLDVAIWKSTIANEYLVRLSKRLDQLCMTAALKLDRQQSRTEIGFDVGMTNSGELWIIEGNYISDIAMFHQLEDQMMYKTIMNNRYVVK